MAGRGKQPPADPTWELLIEPEASRDLNAFHGPILQDALDTIETLMQNPELGDPMRRYNNMYRVYFGDDRYRIVYRLNRKKRLIHIVRVRGRGTAYKGLKNPSARFP